MKVLYLENGSVFIPVIGTDGMPETLVVGPEFRYRYFVHLFEHGNTHTVQLVPRDVLLERELCFVVRDEVLLELKENERVIKREAERV